VRGALAGDDAGKIAGGVVGGVVGFLLVIVLPIILFFYIRKRKLEASGKMPSSKLASLDNKVQPVDDEGALSAAAAAPAAAAAAALLQLVHGPVQPLLPSSCSAARAQTYTRTRSHAHTQHSPAQQLACMPHGARCCCSAPSAYASCLDTEPLTLPALRCACAIIEAALDTPM